jgi:hypothetical protein
MYAQGWQKCTSILRKKRKKEVDNGGRDWLASRVVILKGFNQAGRPPATMPDSKEDYPNVAFS